MNSPVRKRPFRLMQHDTYAVVLDANGRVVAQGTSELCDRVMKTGPY